MAEFFLMFFLVSKWRTKIVVYVGNYYLRHYRYEV